ncbi:hypothetical protein Taro_013369 [Colocasia esculenta]|uniref:AP2/ERF domain-containing protein n=1 Tax=Colocasia esculenta TaxID=4460 RepID=A0A843UFR8_COLES|nr:hypothetical protein [Colocasia esculenta]
MSVTTKNTLCPMKARQKHPQDIGSHNPSLRIKPSSQTPRTPAGLRCSYRPGPPIHTPKQESGMSTSCSSAAAAPGRQEDERVAAAARERRFKGIRMKKWGMAAACAYDTTVFYLQGRTARLNFPNELPPEEEDEEGGVRRRGGHSWRR